VRVRLDVTDVQAGMLLRAAGARRSRRADRARFTVTDGLHLETGRLRLAKYGWVRIAAPCEAQAKLRRLLRRGHARLLNTSVTRHADGRWYAAICYARELHVPEQHAAPAGPVVGLDRGVKTAAIVATSQREPVAELPAVRALRDALRHVKHLQRDVSRTQKGSANRRKAVARLGRAHARAAAVRADALHTFTARLARAHSVVVVEDLKTRNLMANHSLAQAIGDQGWGELARQWATRRSATAGS
jgi:putative transposase